MINLQTRHYTKEILDSDEVLFADIQQNMKELDTINSYLGGHAITIKGLQKVLNNFLPKNEITINVAK